VHGVAGGAASWDCTGRRGWSRRAGRRQVATPATHSTCNACARSAPAAKRKHNRQCRGPGERAQCAPQAAASPRAPASQTNALSNKAAWLFRSQGCESTRLPALLAMHMPLVLALKMKGPCSKKAEAGGPRRGVATRAEHARAVAGHRTRHPASGCGPARPRPAQAMRAWGRICTPAARGRALPCPVPHLAALAARRHLPDLVRLAVAWHCHHARQQQAAVRGQAAAVRVQDLVATAGARPDNEALDFVPGGARAELHAGNAEEVLAAGEGEAGAGCARLEHEALARQVGALRAHACARVRRMGGRGAVVGASLCMCHCTLRQGTPPMRAWPVLLASKKWLCREDTIIPVSHSRADGPSGLCRLAPPLTWPPRPLLARRTERRGGGAVAEPRRPRLRASALRAPHICAGCSAAGGAAGGAVGGAPSTLLVCAA
jgi:hypothetical protein